MALTKTFTSAIQLLQLKLTSADPAQHLPILQAHLLTFLRGSSSLPQQLTTILSPIERQMPAVQNIAISLSHLVSRVSSLASLPTASTACAVLMLSIEGELATSLPQAGALAQALGSRVGVSKATVMQRYKAVYDLIEEYIRDVPWLESHERKGKGRSKVAKRVVVARGLKDVVQFQEELWKKKLESQQKPVLDIEVESNDGDEEESVGSSSDISGMSVIPSHGVISRQDDYAPQLKKTRKSVHDRAVERTSQFLLHPLAKRSHTSSSARPAEVQQGSSGFIEHFFTADDSNLSHAFAQPPTRLQLLASSRGEESINDEELFDDGELEGLLRTSDEVEIIRQTFAGEWNVRDEGTGSDTPPRPQKKRKRGEQDPTPGGSPSKRTKRVNMDALARLLDPDTHLDEVGEDDEFGELSLELGLENDDDERLQTSFGFTQDGDGEEVEEWRPLSPGGGGFDEDRYEA